MVFRILRSIMKTHISNAINLFGTLNLTFEDSEPYRHNSINLT